jgi:hypothetical protein
LILGGAVLLAFQRTVRLDVEGLQQEQPEDGVREGRQAGRSAVGRSLGLAPLHPCHPAKPVGRHGRRDPQSFAACLLGGEALWLGVHSLNATKAAHLRVAVVGGAGDPRAAARNWRVRLAVPPAFALGDPETGANARSPGAPRLFSDAPCWFAVLAGGTAVRLFLLAPESFTAATGALPPPPVRPEHGYGGWRLP